MRNIWFTSDTHYDHANIIRFSRRPQFQEGDEIATPEGRGKWVSREIAEARAKEMNEALVEWHNELVKPGDEVYHLGDFCMSRKNAKERTEHFVRLLNGQYHWVFGNHDHRDARKAEGFASKQHYKELRGIGPDKSMFVLMHYAMRVWNKRHHGAIMLYGHSHGSLPEDPNALTCDVGVDCHNYRPVHVDEILKYMAEKTAEIESTGRNWKGEDHHSEPGVD